MGSDRTGSHRGLGTMPPYNGYRASTAWASRSDTRVSRAFRTTDDRDVERRREADRDRIFEHSREPGGERNRERERERERDRHYSVTGPYARRPTSAFDRDRHDRASPPARRPDGSGREGRSSDLRDAAAASPKDRATSPINGSYRRSRSPPRRQSPDARKSRRSESPSRRRQRSPPPPRHHHIAERDSSEGRTAANAFRRSSDPSTLSADINDQRNASVFKKTAFSTGNIDATSVRRSTGVTANTRKTSPDHLEANRRSPSSTLSTGSDGHGTDSGTALSEATDLNNDIDKLYPDAVHITWATLDQAAWPYHLRKVSSWDRRQLQRWLENLNVFDECLRHLDGQRFVDLTIEELRKFRFRRTAIVNQLMKIFLIFKGQERSNANAADSQPSVGGAPSDSSSPPSMGSVSDAKLPGRLSAADLDSRRLSELGTVGRPLALAEDVTGLVDGVRHASSGFVRHGTVSCETGAGRVEMDAGQPAPTHAAAAATEVWTGLAATSTVTTLLGGAHKTTAAAELRLAQAKVKTPEQPAKHSTSLSAPLPTSGPMPVPSPIVMPLSTRAPMPEKTVIAASIPKPVTTPVPTFKPMPVTTPSPTAALTSVLVPSSMAAPMATLASTASALAPVAVVPSFPEQTLPVDAGPTFARKSDPSAVVQSMDRAPSPELPQGATVLPAISGVATPPLLGLEGLRALFAKYARFTPAPQSTGIGRSVDAAVIVHPLTLRPYLATFGELVSHYEKHLTQLQQYLDGERISETSALAADQSRKTADGLAVSKMRSNNIGDRSDDTGIGNRKLMEVIDGDDDAMDLDSDLEQPCAVPQAAAPEGAATNTSPIEKSPYTLIGAGSHCPAFKSELLPPSGVSSATSSPFVGTAGLETQEHLVLRSGESLARSQSPSPSEISSALDADHLPLLGDTATDPASRSKGGLPYNFSGGFNHVFPMDTARPRLQAADPPVTQAPTAATASQEADTNTAAKAMLGPIAKVVSPSAPPTPVLLPRAGTRAFGASVTRTGLPFVLIPATRKQASKDVTESSGGKSKLL